MRPFFFIFFVSAIILLFGLIEVLLLRTLNRAWWQMRWIRRAAWSLPLLGVGFFVVYALAEYHAIGWLAAVGSIVAVLSLILEIALMISLPVSGVVHFAESLFDRWLRHRRGPDAPAVDRSRRLLLKGAAAAAPATAIMLGLGGVGRALAGADVLKMSFAYSDLPPSLQGLKILHLSDAHLGHYVHLRNIEHVLEQVSSQTPDLILVTGDIADDLYVLGDALRMIADVHPRLGAYASLGNHEHFRGIARVRAIFDASPVQLLVDQGTVITAGASRLYLAAIDDPVEMHNVASEYYANAIGKALRERPSDAFTILMSHRPEAFTDAASRGVHLTLAGHTHGGQIGLMGRSLLEPYYPEKYLWGRYVIGENRLYTTCGVGHWFPFRLGCPPEAPLIEVIRG
jgi:predicted MPP superfamily phosphohydrolase